MTLYLYRPITREIAIRFLGYPVTDYIVEITSAGIRLRKKGKQTWYGPASWEQILNSAARVSARELELEKATRSHA
jgi:hypothetical protein